MHGRIDIGQSSGDELQAPLAKIEKQPAPDCEPDLDAMAEHIDRSANHEQAEAQADGVESTQ